MDTEKKRPFHETVARKLIKQLQEGTAPWQKPWKAGSSADMLPFNPVTGKRYKGINALHLMSEGRGDPRWMTYKQAASMDAQVRRGETGTAIQYWKFTEEKTAVDGAGKESKALLELERPRVFFATVFNAAQIDGLPPLVPVSARDWDPIEQAEKILDASGAAILHTEVDRAFYRPSTDSIHLPGRAQFPSADNYYAVALHELGHWSGHRSRLDRDLSHPFGSEAYAREELRAEIASMLLGAQLGIGHDPGQHAAYVGLWIKALQDNPLEIFRAAAEAEKMQEYVMGFAHKHERQFDAATVLNVAIEQAWRYEGPSDSDDEQRALFGIDLVHRLGFNTLGEVTGSERSQFLVNAQLRLAPGFDLSSDDPATALLEDVRHQELAHRLSSVADELIEAELKRAAGATVKQVLSATVERQQEAGRTLIAVPFKDKEQVKALGAKWDRKEQSWYVPPSVNLRPFARWLHAGRTEPTAGQSGTGGEEAGPDAATSLHRVYLAVSYEDRIAAKEAGAQWDRVARSWFAGPDADLDKLARWLPENVEAQQAPAMTPAEEFAEALKSIGCLVPAGGEHPIMDGRTHRITVVGEKYSKHAGAGFYVAHLDGHPSGYMKNNRTGAEMTWKSKGYVLTPEQKALLAAQATASRQARMAERHKEHEEAAKRVASDICKLMPVKVPTGYMRAKGISPHAGAFTDAAGKITHVPATDVHGKHWTTQYIQEDGTKRFAKGSRKEGCFHSVGGMEALNRAPVIVIAEGYATAAQLKQSLGFATVAAFDSGNLEAVALALRERFPDKPFVIAGDDDRHLELTLGVNPGRSNAAIAARLVNGTLMLPIFAPGENAYPQALEPVTPERYREHQLGSISLGDEQLAALARMKLFTDFNDLANRSELGIEGLDRQVRSVVDDASGSSHNWYRDSAKKCRKGKSR